jgi:hypothetical protein
MKTGNWRRDLMWCEECGNMGHEYSMRPVCSKCGACYITHMVDHKGPRYRVCRRVRYSLRDRLLCLLFGHPQPKNHWEFKGHPTTVE